MSGWANTMLAGRRQQQQQSDRSTMQEPDNIKTRRTNREEIIYLKI
jgi:hypothetical protein